MVEPAPTVNKTANPTTGDAGDTVTFTITITNPAASIDAFDLTLDDIVPAEITYDAGSFIHTAGLAPDSIGEVPHLNAYWAAFPDGSSSTLQFSGELKTSVTPGDIVYNDAIVNFTSLPLTPGQQSPYNTVSFERTGNQADPGGTNNDYTINDPATVTITVPQPIKYLVNTSEAHTLNTDVAIGEIVRYRVSTIIPEGTSNDFQVRDLLPGGLLYIDDGTARLAFISNGAGITSSTITCANDPGSAGDPGSINTALVNCTFPGGAITNQGTANPFSRGNDPWFDFGNLVNSDDDGDREYVVVEFNALVVNISGNQAGTNLSNDFLVYEGGSQIANAQNLTVRVVEPNISVNKSVSGGPYDGGDTVTYTILLTNSSAGNATAGFDLAFRDVFDAALQVQSHTITPPGYAALTDISSGNTIEFGLDRLNAGDSVTVTVTALIPAATEAYLDIPNDADLTYTSLPLDNGTPSNPTGSDNTGTPGEQTGERTGDDGVGGALNDYASTDDADITISQPAIDKQDGAPDPRTIGEETTFPIVVTLPEGTTRDLIVVDNLPTGLQYVSHSLVTTAAGSGGRLAEDYSGSALNPSVTTTGGSGDDVSFDFGDVVTIADTGAPPPDNNSFLILLTARVMDIPQNSGGDTLSNTGYLQFTNPNSGGTETITDDPVTIDLIEPVMEISKTFNPDLVPVNGFSTVTITVSNTGTSPAYDVIIEDSFPTAFYQTVSESVTPGDFTFSSSLSGGNVEVSYSGGPIEAGGSREFQLQVQARGDLAGGDTHDNTATVTQATTIDGPNDYERDEPDVPAEDTITIITPDLTLDKDDGQITATAGEVLVYALTIDNVGLQGAEGVVISDTIPDDTTFNAAGSSPGWSCTGGEGPGTLCTYTVGNLAASGQVQVLFALQVDDPVPAGVDTVENSASVADNGLFGADPTPANNVDDDIDNLDADPDFIVEKVDALLVDADSSGNPSAGDTLRYTVSIQNTGDQDAADVVFDDTPGANTALVAGSVTTSQGSVTTGNTVGDTSVSVALGEIAGDGGSATVRFNVTINDPLPPDTYFVENQGTLSGPDFPDEPSDDPDVPGEDDPTVTLLNGSLIKAVSSTSHGHTSVQDVAIGEIVTYEVTLYVPPGSTNLSTLTDTLTEGLAFVECLSITPGSGNLTTNRAGGFSAACSSPFVNAVPFGSADDEDQGREVQYDLGDLANTTTEAITLVIRYRAVVLNSSVNRDGDQVGNSVVWDYEAGSLSAEALPLDIVEPDMRITKSADTSSATNGDLVTFTLRIIHTGGTSADAFELEMTDPLPPELVYEPGTLTYLSGQIAVVDDTDPANLRATWVDFPQTGTETVLEFQVRVTGLSAGQSTSNEAFLAWTSLPGDVSAPQSTFNTLSTERFYDPPSLVNIYGDSDTLTVRRPAPPSDPPGGSDPGPSPTPTFPASK